jgi:hypothetical protein
MNYFAVHPWMLSCQWHRIPSDLCGTSSNNHWMIWLFKISPWPCSFESWHTVTGEKYTSYNHFHTSPYIFHGISKEILWVALPKRDIPHDLIAIGYTYTLKTTGSTGTVLIPPRPGPPEEAPRSFQWWTAVLRNGWVQEVGLKNHSVSSRNVRPYSSFRSSLYLEKQVPNMRYFVGKSTLPHWPLSGWTWWVHWYSNSWTYPTAIAIFHREHDEEHQVEPSTNLSTSTTRCNC